MSRNNDWRVSDLMREALLNTWGHASRFRGIAVAAVVAGVILAIVASFDSSGLLRQLASDRLADRDVVIVGGPPGSLTTISRDSCERLAKDSDVEYAGLIEQNDATDIPQLGTNVGVVRVSATLLPALTGSSAVVGTGLGESFVGYLQMRNGESLKAVRGRAEPDTLGLNDALSVPLPPTTRRTRTCYIVLNSFARPQAVDPRLLAELDWSGTAPSASVARSETASPVDLYKGRITFFLPAFLGLLLGVMASVVNRARSQEWAVYRMSGSSFRSVALLVSLEQLHLAAVFVVSATLALLVLGRTNIEVSPLACAAAVVSGAATWVTTTALLSLDLCLRPPNRLVKDR